MFSNPDSVRSCFSPNPPPVMICRLIRFRMQCYPVEEFVLLLLPAGGCHAFSGCKRHRSKIAVLDVFTDGHLCLDKRINTLRISMTSRAALWAFRSTFFFFSRRSSTGKMVRRLITATSFITSNRVFNASASSGWLLNLRTRPKENYIKIDETTTAK